MRRLRALLVIGLAVFSRESALGDSYPCDCDPSDTLALARVLLESHGYPIPLDSAGRPYDIRIVPGHDPSKNTSNLGLASTDDNSGAVGSPASTITLFEGTITEELGSPEAVCDPYVLFVILLHEFNHTGSHTYASLDMWACGEWASHQISLGIICSLTGQMTNPSEKANLCKMQCDLLEWFRGSTTDYVLADCDHTPSTAPPTIPGPCPDCPTCPPSEN